MRLIVGLGNPGRRYRDTRHNLGAMVVDTLSRRHGVPLKLRRHESRFGEGAILGERVVLAKPALFMNVSGRAVHALLTGLRLPLGDLIVVHDDIDLQPGRIQKKRRGGDAGHRGLRSIIEELGSGEFYRVRVGIGRPQDDTDISDYVLQPLAPEGEQELRVTIEQAANTVEGLLKTLARPEQLC